MNNCNSVFIFPLSVSARDVEILLSVIMALSRVGEKLLFRDWEKYFLSFVFRLLSFRLISVEKAVEPALGVVEKSGK